MADLRIIPITSKPETDQDVELLVLRRDRGHPIPPCQYKICGIYIAVKSRGNRRAGPSYVLVVKGDSCWVRFVTV